MRTLIVLLCTIAFISFVSADYTPTWNQCGNSSDVFTPTNVTVQTDPKNETQTLISACGTTNSHCAAFTIFNRLNIVITDEWTRVDEDIPYRRVVPSGSAFCFYHTEDFSKFTPRNVTLKATALNILGEEAGCVNMTLIVPFPDSTKLLFKRIEAI